MASVNGIIHNYYENAVNLFLNKFKILIDNDIFNALIKKRKGKKRVPLII
jgi:hypothetical protein